MSRDREPENLRVWYRIVPDLNLTRVGLKGAVNGDAYSVKAEGPNGGYIAVGSHQPVTRTRAVVALSQDDRSWHTVSGTGKMFADAAMTDVARGGPGWVAIGFSVVPFPKPLVWTSTDALHWQRAALLPIAGLYDEPTRLIHGPAGLLALVDGLDGPAEAWTSSDGLHWQAAHADSL